MTADAREKLAAALPESLGPVGLRRRAIPALGVEASVTGYGDMLLDALLPVVDEIAGKRAAEAVGGVRAAIGVLLRRRDVLSEGGLWWSLGELHRTLDADPESDPATVAHNHTRFRNAVAGPWSPCPVSCPAAGLLR